MAWHHCNNVVVTTTNADTSAKCNTDDKIIIHHSKWVTRVSWICCLRFYLFVHSCLPWWWDCWISWNYEQQKILRSILSLVLVGLEMIVVIGLPLNVATVLLGWIFSILYSDFRARGPISILTPPMTFVTWYPTGRREIRLILSSRWISSI